MKRRNLVYLPIDEVTPNPRNPRKHSCAQIRALAKSIKSFGFNAPVLVGHEGVLIGLVADALQDCTARGDFVLDLFLGSGTTLLAAQRTGRKCLGIELDPIYVDTAIIRWQKMTKGEVRLASGQTFAEVRAERAAA